MPAADWIEQPVVDTVHQCVVNATAEETLSGALSAPIAMDPLTWSLLAARGLDPRRSIEEFIRADTGMLVLKLGATEFVGGTAAKVWLPRGGKPKLEDPAGWSSWHEPGTVKAVGTLITEPLPDSEIGPRCRLITETQVEAIDEAALWRFKAYWTAISPLSALIRKRWLSAIKKRVEGQQAGR
jgi:hypothetical protein